MSNTVPDMSHTRCAAACSELALTACSTARQQHKRESHGVKKEAGQPTSYFSGSGWKESPYIWPCRVQKASLRNTAGHCMHAGTLQDTACMHARRRLHAHKMSVVKTMQAGVLACLATRSYCCMQALQSWPRKLRHAEEGTLFAAPSLS
jgi:hypothetical protein